MTCSRDWVNYPSCGSLKWHNFFNYFEECSLCAFPWSNQPLVVDKSRRSWPHLDGKTFTIYHQECWKGSCFVQEDGWRIYSTTTTIKSQCCYLSRMAQMSRTHLSNIL